MESPGRLLSRKGVCEFVLLCHVFTSAPGGTGATSLWKARESGPVTDRPSAQENAWPAPQASSWASPSLGLAPPPRSVNQAFPCGDSNSNRSVTRAHVVSPGHSGHAQEREGAPERIRSPHPAGLQWPLNSTQDNRFPSRRVLDSGKDRAGGRPPFRLILCPTVTCPGRGQALGTAAKRPPLLCSATEKAGRREGCVLNPRAPWGEGTHVPAAPQVLGIRGAFSPVKSESPGPTTVTPSLPPLT